MGEDTVSVGEVEWDTGVDAVAAGDPGAVDRLLGAVRPIVVRYCRARLGRQQGNYAAADGVAREVCLAVLSGLRGYRRQGGPFLAFVYRTAAHAADVAEVRARPGVRIPRQSRVAVRHVTEDGPADRVRDMVQDLSGPQRDIVLLRLVVGLSVAETAAAVGSTPGAVRAVQHRALTGLRKALAVEEVC
jgi:RNA polymerase sigma-70 factor (ECF subfamily)